MNRDTPFPLDPDAAEREWQAQERARHEYLGRAGGAASDPAAARYREIAAALREPLPLDLPRDFATHVVRLVQREPDDVLERRLTRGLLVALGLVAVAMAGLYGRDWFHGSLPAGSPQALLLFNPWALSLAACLGVSAIAAWRRPLPGR